MQALGTLCSAGQVSYHSFIPPRDCEVCGLEHAAVFALVY